MTKYFLQIKLLSPLTSAAGEGRVGLVDRDITFDDLGLPTLPGRRLKGLWREAYRDITDAWQQCGKTPTSVDKIFGKTGQRHNDGSACFYVGNAKLKNALSLKKWLEYLQYRDNSGNSKILIEDVVNHYTSVRTQTAIDRHTGSAKENTLRLTRTLESGWVFRAPVHFNEPPNSKLKSALALAAATLRYMGTARTRGLGKVECRLFEENNGNEKDLTPDLSQPELPSITGADVIRSASQSEKKITFNAVAITDLPTHVLRYRLNLKEPAIIPFSDGDPNTVVTRKDIPGSHLWGATAWHYLKDANHAPTDPAFRHAFLNGGLRFLTAYPEVHDRDNFDEPDQRTIPIPHSIRELKEKNRTLVDFSETLNDDQKRKPKRRIGSRYARIYTKKLETTTVSTALNYHHARVPDDRSIGRAIEGAGSIFKYEAILPDQSFQGAVLGTEDNLNKLKKLLANVKKIRLGRSRSAQYGQAEFAWVDEAPLNLSERIEWEGFIDVSRPENTPALLNNYLIITILSPVLAVNDEGHPDTNFPIRELAHRLKLKTDNALELTASYTRTEMISGYHTHLRLPRQQQPAIAAGSVFEFKLNQKLSEKGEKGLLKLEQDGIGIRKGEGYGRIAVNRQHDLGLIGKVEVPFEKASIKKPTEKAPEEIQSLLQGIVENRCRKDMEKEARHIADQMHEANKIPNNTLLGRLRLFIQQDQAALENNLNKLRKKPAEEKLKSYRIDKGELQKFDLPDHLTLFSLFMTAGEDPKKFTKTLIESKIKEVASDCDNHTQKEMVDTLLNEQSWRMCKHFLDYLITALRRKS